MCINKDTCFEFTVDSFIVAAAACLLKYLLPDRNLLESKIKPANGWGGYRAKLWKLLVYFRNIIVFRWRSQALMFAWEEQSNNWDETAGAEQLPGRMRSIRNFMRSSVVVTVWFDSLLLLCTSVCHFWPQWRVWHPHSFNCGGKQAEPSPYLHLKTFHHVSNTFFK